MGNYAARLLGREDVRPLTDVVKRDHPVVVEELTPSQLSLGQVQQVLQALLEEGVSIRDLVRIYEALSLRAVATKDHDVLVEAARNALGPAIVAPHVHDGVVHVITFEPGLEQRMLEAMRPSEEGPVLVLDPLLGQRVISTLAQLLIDAEPQRATCPRVRAADPARGPPDGAAGHRAAARAVVPRALGQRPGPVGRRHQRRPDGRGGLGMRLASGTVLGLAAVVSSPALWQGLNGELALDVTLTRYLVAVLVVWVALSVVAALVGDAPQPRAEEAVPPPGGEDPSVPGTLR